MSSQNHSGASANADRHATLYSFHPVRGRDREVFSQHESDACVQALQTNNCDGLSQLLFLRGHSSSDWLSSVAAACNTDPEFINSNMLFRCRRTYFAYPSLPSAYDNMIRLRIATIGSRDVRFTQLSQSHLESVRLKAKKQMDAYRHDLMLGSNAHLCDSIVRDFHVLDGQYFIVEQEIAICLHFSDEGWIGEQSCPRHTGPEVFC